MSEAELEQIQEGIASIALYSQVEMIWRMQDEFICALALDDTSEHFDTQLFPQY